LLFTTSLDGHLSWWWKATNCKNSANAWDNGARLAPCIWHCHGCWKSENAKDSYVEDDVEHRLTVTRSMTDQLPWNSLHGVMWWHVTHQYIPYMANSDYVMCQVGYCPPPWHFLRQWRGVLKSIVDFDFYNCTQQQSKWSWVFCLAGKKTKMTSRFSPALPWGWVLPIFC